MAFTSPMGRPVLDAGHGLLEIAENLAQPAIGNEATVDHWLKATLRWRCERQRSERAEAAAKDAIGMKIGVSAGPYLRSEEGSFYLEILMATLIFFFVMAALLGLFAGAAQLLATARSDSIGLQLANRLIEQIRLTKYESVGLTDASGNEPPGIFLRRETTTTAEGVLYEIQREITWVDDPADGTYGGSPADAQPNDYKRAVVMVRRPGRVWIKLASDVKLMTIAVTQPTVNYISPSPSAGSTKIIGGPESDFEYPPYFDQNYYRDDEHLTPSLQVPLVVEAQDEISETSGLATVGFYVNGAILHVESGSLQGSDASLTFNPLIMYWTDDGLHPEVQFNGIIFWNPFWEEGGRRVYPDGRYEVSVQVWNALGGRDQRTITFILDKDSPYWPSGSWINAEPWQDPYTIRLTWSPASDSVDDPTVYSTKYDIYRDGSYLTTVQGTARVAYDTGLAQWSTHTYKIVAVSPGGRRSSEFSGGSPTATTWIDLAVTKAKVQGKYRATLSWVKPAGVSVSKYQVWRGVNGGSLSLYADNISGGSSSYVDNPPGGLGNGTYTYRLIAIKPDGSTNRSQDVTITIP